MYNFRITDENGMDVTHYYIPCLFNNGQKATDTVYSDRLYQWDSKKHDELCTKHFGNTWQYWSGREPEKIEAFLRDYCNDPKIVLCRIEQHVNRATGYPVWRIDFLHGV